jgi:hypothetical protein
MVTNTRATLKYLSPSYGPRVIVRSYDVNVDSIAQLARSNRAVDVVFLDRRDSEMFREETLRNARLLADVRSRCAVARSTDHTHGPSATLHVLRLSGCASRVLPYAVQ